MLNELFGSEARAKILNLLILHPDKKYLLRHLTLDLELQSGLIRRELDNLIKFGLINEETETNISSDADKKEVEGGEENSKKPIKKEKILKKAVEKKYFSVNKSFILYPEIKSLFIKAQILSSQKFIDGLQKIAQPKFLALTGIFTNYPEARTDMLIVGSVRRLAFLKLIKELELNLEREINFTIMDETEFKYRQEIMDIFLYNILGGKNIVLINNFKEKTN